MRRLELVEREVLEVDPRLMSLEDLQAIDRRARGRISIDPPNALTGAGWRMVSEGWIGQIPVTEELVLVVRPKVPIGNLFRMIEVAYRLPGLEFPEGPSVSASEIADLFDCLAGLLARRTLLRVRRGLHREYLRYEEALPYLRGRLMPLDLVRRGRGVEVPCQFEDQTCDIGDNQILHWTLRRIARSGLGREATRAQVRQGIRAMAGSVRLEPFRGVDCLRRVYQRLNADYHPLHGLCRFFLESLGPTHETGDAAMVPFLVDMDRLFELFLAEWLETKLPTRYSLAAQERFDVDAGRQHVAQVDLLIRESRSGSPLAVLDTKYKSSKLPSLADLYQINAYADLVGASFGFLTYPSNQVSRYQTTMGTTRISTLGFDLSGDLEAAGAVFLAQLVEALELAAESVA